MAQFFGPSQTVTSAILERSPVLLAIVEFGIRPQLGDMSPLEALEFYESLGFQPAGRYEEWAVTELRDSAIASMNP